MAQSTWVYVMSIQYRITFHYITLGYDVQPNHIIFQLDSFESLNYSLNANEVTEATLVLLPNVDIPAQLNSRGICMRIWRKTEEDISYTLEGSTDWLVMKVVETISSSFENNRKYSITAFHPNIVMKRRVIAFPANTSYADKISAWPDNNPLPNWNYPIVLAKEYFRQNVVECADINSELYNPLLKTTLSAKLTANESSLYNELTVGQTQIDVKDDIFLSGDKLYIFSSEKSETISITGVVGAQQENDKTFYRYNISAATVAWSKNQEVYKNMAVLKVNLTSSANTMVVNSNIFNNQDFVYLSTADQYEKIKINSSASSHANGWQYTILRGNIVHEWSLDQTVYKASTIVLNSAIINTDDIADSFASDKTYGAVIYLQNGSDYEQLTVCSVVSGSTYIVARRWMDVPTLTWDSGSPVFYQTYSDTIPIDLDRRISVSIQTPPSSPNTQNPSAEYTESTSGYQNLLNVMQNLSAQIDNYGNRHYFQLLTHNGTTRLLTRRNYLNTDRSDKVFFGFKYGNLSEIVITNDYENEVNVVYAGGDGSQEAQLVHKVVQGTVNPFFRSEEFVTFGEINNRSALEGEGRRYLYANRAKKIIRARVSNTGAFRYGKDYNHGDRVTLVVEGAEYQCHIYAVSVQFSSNQENIDIYLDTQIII